MGVCGIKSPNSGLLGGGVSLIFDFMKKNLELNAKTNNCKPIVTYVNWMQQRTITRTHGTNLFQTPLNNFDFWSFQAEH